MKLRARNAAAPPIRMARSRIAKLLRRTALPLRLFDSDHGCQILSAWASLCRRRLFLLPSGRLLGMREQLDVSFARSLSAPPLCGGLHSPARTGMRVPTFGHLIWSAPVH